MKILSIETSCDETAISILQCDGDSITVLGNALSSQIELHAQYGGVFPALAKRAHVEKIMPLLSDVLHQAEMGTSERAQISEAQKESVKELCTRETGLGEQLISFAETHTIPNIDHIAVTAGPGLEPALWVGINAAQALGVLWQKPVHPINHMEGHILSAMFEQKSETVFTLHDFAYPALALLVSGGHTELVLMDQPLSYKKIGQTRDDAIGEAFDKVARILGLPYPGGPKISALAKEARDEHIEHFVEFPRPMLHSKDYDFSFSGLKTAVLYATRDKELTEEQKKSVAKEFEDAAIEVLVSKTMRAIKEYEIQTVVVGGGVASNTHLRTELAEHIASEFPNTKLLFPTKELSTDNSVMIGMASYYRLRSDTSEAEIVFKANGNRSIEEESTVK